jgi:hypothetical protein
MQIYHATLHNTNYTPLHYTNCTALHDTPTTATAATALLLTTLHYTTVHNTTVHNTTLQNTTTSYTTPQLQLQLHKLHYTTPTTPLHYTITTTPALHHTTSSSCGQGDHCNHSKNHNHLAVHQWIRSAIHALQQLTPPIVSYLWNYRHRLVRYYRYCCKQYEKVQHHAISRVDRVRGWRLASSQKGHAMTCANWQRHPREGSGSWGRSHAMCLWLLFTVFFPGKKWIEDIPNE